MRNLLVVVAGAFFASGTALAFDCMLPLLSYEQRATTTSSVCLGCHGGEIERAPLVDENHSHPSDVLYEGEPEEGFRAANEITEPVILVDGMVTCVSCHTPDSQELYRAALPPGRELCLACHVKE